MRKSFFLFAASIACLMLMSVLQGFAQVSSVQWQKGFGRQHSDLSAGVIQTKDGGYLISGVNLDPRRPDFHGKQDILLIKLDKFGNQQWDKLYGGSEVDDVRGNTLVEVSDGFIIAGSSHSTDGDVTGNHDTSANATDIWLFKVDFSGNIIWQKSIGGGARDQATSLILTPNMELLIAGATTSNDGDILGFHTSTNSQALDILAMKLDLTGNIQWQKCFGGSSFDFAYEINQMNDGSYLILGHTRSNDGDVVGIHGSASADLFLLKIDAAGTIISSRCIGGSGWEYDASFAQKPGQGDFMILMTSNSTDDIFIGVRRYEYNLLNMDPSLNIRWMKSYGGSMGEAAQQIINLPTGGYILGGITQSTDGDVNSTLGVADSQGIWLLEVDDTGRKINSTVLGGSYNDVFSAIAATSDSGFVFTGFSYSSDGTVKGVLGAGDYDIWVLKMGVATKVGLTSINDAEMKVFPTVTEGPVYIQFGRSLETDVSLRNTCGGLVAQVKNTGKSTTLDISKEATGVYFLTVTADREQCTMKIIKQ